MPERAKIREGQCGPRYLRIPDVRINAALGPVTVEVFLDIAEFLFVSSGLVDLETIAAEYRARIHMGVHPHFRIVIDA